MPVQKVPGTGQSYYLITFDRHGVEVEDGGSQLSDRIAPLDPNYTDVFLLVHGWKGDVPAAKDQYDRWIGAMIARDADAAAMAAARPGGFRPLWIGLHWPSLPWGDEEVGGLVSFAAGAAAAIDGLVDRYVDRLGGDERLRVPIRQIFERAAEEAEPEEMPADVADAYHRVNGLADLPADGVAGSPDGDRLPFDPVQRYDVARTGDLAFGGGGLGSALLSPLRQLSFWAMKKRARTVGESGFHDLLASLAGRLGPGVRFHVMGHSFGCIASSAGICGRSGATPNRVASLALVQGALSLWSYCSDIPGERGTPGYFERLVKEGLVSGATFTTKSKADRAVGFFYPLAAGIAGEVAYEVGARLPKFGGVGTFGAQGLGELASTSDMLPSDGVYSMKARRVLNLEASAYIRRGGGLSGAHSDIAGPEVAHAVWSAAIPS